MNGMSRIFSDFLLSSTGSDIMFFRPTCLFCQYERCSVDARICPACGHLEPNPGLNARIDKAVSSLMLAAFIIALGAVFAIPGWLVHSYIGVGIAVFTFFCACKAVVMGVWYAFDPTLTIIPSVRPSH